MKKKILAILLMLTLVVSAMACSSKKEKTDEEKEVTVELGEYKGLVLSNVTEKEVEDAITELLKENAGSIELDRAAAEKDTVNIDYKGIYYGDISVTFTFELVEGYSSYYFVPGTLEGTNFTPLYTSEANNLVGLTPAITSESGSNHYLNESGAIVIADTAAKSLTLSIKADYVKQIIEKQYLFTAKTKGVKITSMKVLAVASTGDKDYTCNESYVGDDNFISSVSYEAFANVYGVAFSGGTSSDYDLVLGSNTFIPGFESALVGLSKGDEKDVELNFPSTYSNNPRLAGQPVVFQVKINKVCQDPVFDDVFAKYMDFESAEEYRKYIVDTMNNNYYEDQISDKLLEICTVNNIPASKIEEYKNDFVSYYTSMAQYYASLYTSMGYSITTDYVLTNFMGFASTDELNKVGEEYANNYLKMRYIVEKIAEVEKIEVSDEEFNTTAKDYAENNGYDSYEEFLEKNATTDEDKADIVSEVRYIAFLDKVLDFIKENAVIEK